MSSTFSEVKWGLKTEPLVFETAHHRAPHSGNENDRGSGADPNSCPHHSQRSFTWNDYLKWVSLDGSIWRKSSAALNHLEAPGLYNLRSPPGRSTSQVCEHRRVRSNNTFVEMWSARAPFCKLNHSILQQKWKDFQRWATVPLTLLQSFPLEFIFSKAKILRKTVGWYGNNNRLGIRKSDF